MNVIFPVETAEDRRHVKTLYTEYLEFVNQKVGEFFGFNFEVEPAVERAENARLLNRSVFLDDD